MIFPGIASRLKTHGRGGFPSGFERFTVDRIAQDVDAGIFAANTPIYNSKLRPDFDNNPYSMFKTVISGKSWMEHYVNPTAQSGYLPTPTGFANHFRSEVSGWPWNIKYALGTEYWKGISYYMPNDVSMWTNAAIVVMQFKDGSVAGDPSPAISLELAYPGQLNSSSIYRKTPLGGEVQIINHCRGWRWTPANSAVRLAPGMRLDIIVHVVFGEGENGLFEIWLNGTKYPFPGYTSGGTTYDPGDVGTTVIGNYPGFGLRGANSKHGIYALQYKTPTLVSANAAVGHTYTRLLTTDFCTVVRTPSDPDYLSYNAKAAVDTSSFNL